MSVQIILEFWQILHQLKTMPQSDRQEIRFVCSKKTRIDISLRLEYLVFSGARHCGEVGSPRLQQEYFLPRRQ